MSDRLAQAISLLERAYGDLDVSHTAIIVGDAASLLRDIGEFLSTPERMKDG